MFSGSIRVIIGVSSLFCYWRAFHCMDAHNLFIQSPGDGHLDYFQSGTIGNKTGINTFICLPWRLRQWKFCLQCGRPVFNPWVRKMPWKRHGNPLHAWRPLLPGEFRGQRRRVSSSLRVAESQTRLCDFHSLTRRSLYGNMFSFLLRKYLSVRLLGHMVKLYLTISQSGWSSSTLATCCEEMTHWKRLMLGKIEGRRKRGWWKMRWLDSIISSIDMNLYKLWEIVEDRRAWNVAVHGVTKSWTRLSDWTTRWLYHFVFPLAMYKSYCWLWVFFCFSDMCMVVYHCCI